VRPAYAALLVANAVYSTSYAATRLVLDDVPRARHSSFTVTARSIVWGAAVMAPLAVSEWKGGGRPSFTAGPWPARWTRRW
jgi:hypothetical protein